MIVATCASLVSREPLLRQAVESLLPQVDAMCVYLNGHAAIPDFLRHPKVLYAVLSAESGYRGAEGKFWFWDADLFKAAPAPWSPDTVGLTFDDDIVYPGNYAARMVAALDRRPGSIACVHGSILVEPFVGWRESRRCVHFADELLEDARVHVPGTGTLAFRVRDWPFHLAEYPWSHCDDPVAGISALRRGVEVWSVARPARWLRPLPNPRAGTSISRQRIMAGNDDAETRMIAAAGPWPALEVPAEVEKRAAVRKRQRAILAGRQPSRAAGRPARRAPRALPESSDPGHAAAPLHFAILVTGWNCAGLVAPCWQSIAAQAPGRYTWEAFFYDDGSTDGTWRAMAGLSGGDRLHLRGGQANLGAAHARHQLIAEVTAPETVCILLDMDDQLEPGALARVAREYRAHPRTWLTYGSWRADRVQGAAQAATQRPYASAVMAARSYRQATFRAAPLRTFRRHLADGVEPPHLQDAAGEWLRCATDVALMWALLEQCAPERVRWIGDVLYRYTWKRPTGTVARYGADQKAAAMRHLMAMAPPGDPSPAAARDGSAAYWERRYRAGGTSGAGSYGDLAEFKAEILNRFIEEQGVESVLELGCGDGNQLELLRAPRYTGIDVSEAAVKRCHELFALDPSRVFFTLAEDDGRAADLALSLDVVFHLVEDDVFERYMRRLFAGGGRFVVIYSSDREHNGAGGPPHVRHRRFSEWIAAHEPAWRLRERIPNRYPHGPLTPGGSWSDFFIFERRP